MREKEKATELGIAMDSCFYCGKEKNIVFSRKGLTPTKAKEFKEEIGGKVFDLEPCNECLTLFKKGFIFLMVIDPEKSWADENGVRLENIYKTGNNIWLKKEAALDCFSDEPNFEKSIVEFEDDCPTVLVEDPIIKKIIEANKDSHPTTEDYFKKERENV